MTQTLMRLMGISATGKGTRTLALIRYLVEDLNRKPMTFKIKINSEGLS